MTYKNGRLVALESGVAGVPKMNHLDVQRACDRWLAARGIVPRDRNEHLFDRPRRAKR